MDCYRMADPCANCGREDAGRMVSSEWGHSYPCCSDACGKRLAHKMRNEMGIPHEECPASWGDQFSGGDSGRLALRIRIKQLSHRLKATTHPTERK